jgi:hypothetical protein
MKIKLFILIIILLITITVSGEAIFLKDGSILEGKIIKDTDKYVQFIMKNNLQTKIARKRIIRTLYHDNYKNKVYIKMLNNSIIEGYIVFDNKKEYTVRKKLYNKKEFKISIKKVNGVLKKMPSSTAIDSSEKKNNSYDGKKWATTLGIGYSTGLGDTADSISYALPLIVEFDYAVSPSITIGFDGHYWLSSASALEYVDWTSYQYGISSKFWSDKTYEGLYIGALLAKTYLKIEVDYFGTTATEDKTNNTLGFNAGYVVDTGGMLLNFSTRYDAVDLKFADGFFTASVAAGVKF